MDTDSVVAGNVATGLLARRGDIGRPKTRLVSALLEGLGIDSRIVERRFDEAFRLQGDEPRLALAGFDDPAPRRLIGDRFSHVVDIGLGGGPVEYLDMLIHSFPSELDPSTAFPAEKATRRPLRSAYQAEIGRLIEAGVDEGEARCGITEVAGISVGAAFVGAIAGALGVVDVLRYLHGGPDFSVVSLDLRSPNDMRSASNENPGAFGNLGYCLTRD